MANNLQGPSGSSGASWTPENVGAKKPTSKGTKLEKNVEKAAKNPIISAHREKPATNLLSNKSVVKQAPKIDLSNPEIAIRELKAACSAKNGEKLSMIIKQLVQNHFDFSAAVMHILDHGTLDEVKFFFDSPAGIKEFKRQPSEPNLEIERFVGSPERTKDRLERAEIIATAATRAFADNKIYYVKNIQPILTAAILKNDLALASAACTYGADPTHISSQIEEYCSREMREFLNYTAKTAVKQAPKIDLSNPEIAIRELKAACSAKNGEKLSVIIKQLARNHYDFSAAVMHILDHGTLDEIKFFLDSPAGFEEFKRRPPRDVIIQRFVGHPEDRLERAEIIATAATRAFHDNKIVYSWIIQPMLKEAIVSNDLALASAACSYGAKPLGFSPQTLRECSPEMRELLEYAAKPKPKG